MASLTGQSIKDTYQSLLKTDDNGLITNAFKGVTDGSGSASGLYLRNNGVLLSGSIVISGSLLYSGSTINATVTSASYALTASYAMNGESINTGSLLVTASVNSNTITFTKGDASTFDITVDTGSATPIDTGSLATTGSNTFVGNQTISGSVDINKSISTQMFMHPQTITEDITIPDNYNAFLVGPVGFTGTVTVGTGSNLSIL